MNFVDH